MQLTVKYGGVFYEKIKKYKEVIEVKDKKEVSILELLEILFKKYPQLGQVFRMDPFEALKSSLVIVNGDLLSVSDKNSVNKKLQDGDEIYFMPIIHGG